MDELSLLADLLCKIEALAREAHARRVTGVHVRIGALAHISADHLRDHFERGVRGTAAEGAELDIQLGSDIHDVHAQDILLQSIEVA